MARRRSHIVRAQGAFGSRNKSAGHAAKDSHKKFTYEERDAICAVVHYEQRGYMTELAKPVCEMKSVYLRSMLERINQYLGNQWLEAGKRQMFEGIRKKLVKVLEEKEKQANRA